METILAGFLLIAGGVFFLKLVLWLTIRGMAGGANREVHVEEEPQVLWTVPMEANSTNYPEGKIHTQTWNPETKQYESGYQSSGRLADNSEHNDTYRLEAFADFMKGK